MKKVVEYFSKMRESLEKNSDIFNSAQNSTNIGTARELLVSSFLKNILPQFLTFNSGEIFDSNEKESGQIDIIISSINCSKLYITGNISIFPVESVLSAIEIKSSLTTGKGDENEFARSLNACAKVKELDKLSTLKSTSFDSQKVSYSIFAFKGPDIQTIINKLNESENGIQSLPDCILILNKAYLLLKVKNWHVAGKSIKELYERHEDKNIILFYYYRYLMGITSEYLRDYMFTEIPLERYEHIFTNTLDELSNL